MTLYFAWVQPGACFDSVLHARTDEPVFEVKICEREGQIPKAHVRVLLPSHPRAFSKRLRHAFISYQDPKGGISLLFSGRVIGVPQKIQGETYEIILSSEPEDAQKKLELLHESSKHFPLWDPLFVSEKDHPDPSTTLEAQMALYYWDRCTQGVSLSNLLEGPQKVFLGGQFFRDSLKISLNTLPLREIKVRLSAEWIQRYEGLTDISFLLNSAFQEGLVNTLTGPDLEAKWWKTGEKIGRSGYWIASSHLQEILPPATGILNLYPSLSAPFRISPHDSSLKDKGEMHLEDSPQIHRFKRFWYKASLKLGWQYKQKRREILEFTLPHSFQPFFEKSTHTKTLEFRLNNIFLQEEPQPWIRGILYVKGQRVRVKDRVYEALFSHKSRFSFQKDQRKWRNLGLFASFSHQSQRASFFTTDRGRQALEHAIERARAHLAASSRAIEIRFEGPLDPLLNVTCDHQIFLEDERLPGQKVSGKVKSYTAFFDGKTGTGKVEIVLGCTVGHEVSPDHISSPSRSSYVTEEYCEEGYQDGSRDFYASPSKIRYLPYQHQQPTSGLLNPGGLGARDLVEEMKVLNPVSLQEAHLEKNQYPYRHTMKEVLNEVKTDLQIHLRDLHSLDTLEHTIAVVLPDPWSAPQQISLTSFTSSERI